MNFDEARIIRMVLSGDVNAYEQLVKANEKNVYNLAFKMTGSEQDAMDISQDAFLKAYINLPGFNGTSKFSVWLYRLTYNLCIDFLRKKKRECTVPAEYENDSGQTVPVQQEDSSPGIEDAVIKTEQYREVMQAINMLPEKYRGILLMHCIDDMKYSDIARALDINEGTVKSRLSRARRLLAEKLQKDGTTSKKKRHKNSQEVKSDE